MDPKQCVEHAQTIARSLVRLGVLDVDTARQHYLDYVQYVRLGTLGSFSRMLLTRRAIDGHAYAMLERVAPFQQAVGVLEQSGRMSSMVIRLPRDQAPPTAAAPAPVPPVSDAERTVLDMDAPELAERTMGFDDVLAPPGAQAAPDRGLEVSSSGEDLAFPELAEADRVRERRHEEYDPTTRLREGASVASTAAGDSGDAPADSADVFLSGSAERDEGRPFLEPQVGGFLGEFELVEVLGQGGMGVVFEARRRGTQEAFAVKVLRVREGASTGSRRERFRREVDAMQRLRHPAIVAVHGYGRDGPFDWFVMDYVDGRDLASLLREEALDLPARLRVIEQVCQAIAHSHEQGVIHRDLKPQNVLVDREGDAHVLDFGLAKLLDSEEGLTHTGSSLGTPFYMSPEQVADPTSVGPPSDVFALGVILYEALTGHRPFTGHSAGEVGNKILTHDPPLPSRLAPELHTDLDAICMRALEKRPERRYATCQALVADLTRHRQGERVAQRSLLETWLPRLERHRQGLLLGALFATALFLVLAAGVGLVVLLLG